MTFRKPIFSRPWQVTINVSWQPANFALTYKAGQIPFNQDDWPVPRMPGQPQPHNYPQNLALTFKSRLIPFRQTSWPVPFTPQRPVSSYTFISTAIPSIIPAPPSSPFNQKDWPVPRAPLPIQPIPFYQQNNINLLTVTYTPAQNSGWTLPIVPVQLQYLPPTNVALLNTAPPAPMPFGLDDWPQPIILRQPQPHNYPHNFALTYAAGQIPFNQDSWPVPQQPQRATSISTWINATVAILTPNVQPPNRQADWPVPQRPGQPASVYTFINTPGPARIPNTKPPNAQYNWPVPQRPGQPSSIYFWKNSPFTIIPAPPVVTTPADTHDGVWDEKAWRKYQQQIKKRRQQLAKREQAEQDARTALRQKLLNLYRGIPEAKLELDAAEPTKLEIKDDNADKMAQQLLAVRDQLNQRGQQILEAYLREMERAEEEEIETLMSAIL